MQVVNPQLITDKRVLLRLDIDVPLVQPSASSHQPSEWIIEDDFRLEAGVPTLQLCLKFAKSVTVVGHLGRPGGQRDKKLSIAPVKAWFDGRLGMNGPDGKLQFLENLRFDPREESLDQGFAKELAVKGDVFINEAFASYRPAASTTLLPSILPHGAGLRFNEEVKILTKVREKPIKPLVVIMGGAKIEDKLPVISVLAKIADAVLVGGKLPIEIKEKNIAVASNVFVGMLNEEGTDIAPSVTDSWERVLSNAGMVVWNGPVGFVEDEKNIQTRRIAEIVTSLNAQSVVGGGDTIGALKKWNLLDKFSFVSTGGGAMLKFLSDGTLPTIQALS